MSKVISIKEEVASDLALRNTVQSLFDKVNKVEEPNIEIDFSNINSISRSFAHEYLTQKQLSSKQISEINTPENVEKMFQIVKNSSTKAKLLDIDSSQVVSL